MGVETHHTGRSIGANPCNNSTGGRKTKVLFIAIGILILITAIIALRVFFGLGHPGNAAPYALRRQLPRDNSPLRGKTILCLGSSISSGFSSGGVSFLDYLARIDGCRIIQETVSATTRAPRPGEQEGVDYYYRTREQFQQLIENDQVVEHNFYNGNYYGTLREEVDKRLAARKVVVLVIDVHGAANIRRMFPGATTVFLLPPSVEELERRLRGRGTETEDSIQERLATARQELAQQDKFTLKLVNDQVDTCADALYQAICQRIGAAE